MANIFHLTNPTIAAALGLAASAIRYYWCVKGQPHAERRCYSTNTKRPTPFFAAPDVIAALRTYRVRGHFDPTRLLEMDRDYRTAHGLCGGGVWLGTHKVSRARLITKTLTADELARLTVIQKAFSGGLAMAFWDRIASIDPTVRECLILHPEVFAAVLATPTTNLPLSPAVWAQWAADFVLANSDAPTITALAA
jgi:hypothetical protein